MAETNRKQARKLRAAEERKRKEAEAELVRRERQTYRPHTDAPRRILNPVGQGLRDAKSIEWIAKNIRTDVYEWRRAADSTCRFSEESFLAILKRMELNYCLLDTEASLPEFHLLFNDADGRGLQIDGFERARTLNAKNRVFFLASALNQQTELFLARALTGSTKESVPDAKISNELARLGNCYFKLLAGEHEAV